MENRTVTYMGRNTTNPANQVYNMTTQVEAVFPMAGSPRDEPIYKMGIGLLLWTLPIIITLGTVGNIFSFMVMLQREMRQTSTFFYLAVLAIADTIVLFMSAFKTWIRTFSGFEMLHISDFSCKLFTFLTYFSLHLSAWLIVAVTIERFIVVWFPLRASSICSMRRAKLTTVCLALTLAMLNGHLFWTAELVGDSGRVQCAMLKDNRFLYQEVIPWLHLTLYSFVPFLSLLIFNILIIISLIRHRQMITSQMTRDDKRTRYNHRKLAITLLCISFVWILTTTPSALFTVIRTVNNESTTQHLANIFFVKVICYIFLYINHSINFFLYCITGQTFRRAFIKLVCRACQRKRKPKPRLHFRASHSGSGQETSFPLMSNMYSGNFSCCTRVEESSTRTRQSPLSPPTT